jgi:hypothetical protein
VSLRAATPRCIAATLALAVTGWLAPAHAAEPIPWQQAGDHVGRRIVVEGVVAATRPIDAGCVLAFTDEAHPAFTVTLVAPLFSRGPARPEEYYRGRRVRVTGVVRQLAGHPPEIVVRNPGEISVVESADLADRPAAAAADPTPGATIPEAATVVEIPSPSDADRPTDVEAAGNQLGVEAAPRNAARPEPAPQESVARESDATRCGGARKRWRAVETRIESALGALSACVRSERYRCRSETGAVYAALADLAAAEGAIEASCP